MHTWKFFRTGGLDQVTLASGADLLALEQLDQKLWVALSCPVKGLELDEATLRLIDGDGDGRIRVPELLAAIKWAAPRLKDVGVLLAGTDGLPLSAINEATPEGKIALASARQILANLGKKNATAIMVADTSNTAAIFSASALNGDGVIPPEATDDPAVQALIKDIVACLGGTADRTGSTGVTAAQVDTFFAELTAYAAWVGSSSIKEIAVLGEATEAAVAAIKAVRAKVDDYFGRCRLAAFDTRAAAALNRAEDEYLAIAAKDLKITADEVAGFPLASIEGGRPLPLFEGVNPAWVTALATLQKAVVTPVFGPGRVALAEADWIALNTRFAPYETWLGSKAGSAVEKLGLARIKEILAGPGREALAELVAKDKALEPEFNAISDVNRLTHYHRDLRTLLHNFVNFADFYSPDRLAVFQAGTLYFDSRSTELCIRVDGPNPLAAMSKMYIAYCACSRAGGKAMNIAACVTQGDSDYLFVGRHGVFYDRAGNDWDAAITGIVDNPISIRQAFWSPYKKFIRMIEEQVAKRAAAAEAASTGKLAAAAETAANADKAKLEPPKKIDVGTVAALGVAVGAIGGALGAIATGLARLALWQLPLVVLGLVLVISLPSMAIAWLKLRQRTLGPILEGNGWAVNGRVAINIPFGSKLTDLARLPANAQRSLEDPYEDKAAATRRRLVVALVLVLIGAAVWVRWDATQHRDAAGHPRYFWQERPAVETPAAAPTPADAPAAPKPTTSRDSVREDPATEAARVEALRARQNSLREQMTRVEAQLDNPDRVDLRLRKEREAARVAGLEAQKQELWRQYERIREEDRLVQLQLKAGIPADLAMVKDTTDGGSFAALREREKALSLRMQQIVSQVTSLDQMDAELRELRQIRDLEERNRHLYSIAFELSQIHEALSEGRVYSSNLGRTPADAESR